jgi:hypothetical protein
MTNEQNMDTDELQDMDFTGIHSFD